MANSGEVSVVVNAARGFRASESGAASPTRAGEAAQKPARNTVAASAPAASAAAGDQRSGSDGTRSADSDATRAAVEKVQDFVQVVQRDLQFSVDEESGRTIVTVLDSESGEMIRQIPPERILQIAENLDEVNGILFRGSA